MGALPWVREVAVKIDSQPVRALNPEQDRPNGLKKVSHVIAVSSCKGGKAAS